MKFSKLEKLHPGDKVAILSPSFAAPGRWPHVYQFGLKRVREEFGLTHVDFPTTSLLGSSTAARSADLSAAFTDKSIKAIITSIGGDDQVTYVKNLDPKPFISNPKPFFGISDNSHLCNFLWLNGIPSYYGGALFTEFALQGEMDPFTAKYLKHGLFDKGMIELEASKQFYDFDPRWEDLALLLVKRPYQPNDGWYWDGAASAEGITWGGCVESIDEMLRHGVPIPTLDQFRNVVLFLETSEEIPPLDYVRRVLRALGERGVLERVRGILVGRPKAWSSEHPNSDEVKAEYRRAQRETMLQTIRRYNSGIPIIQNLDIGHTGPQICLPMGKKIVIDSNSRKISVEF